MVEELLSRLRGDTKEILSANRHLVAALRDALLVRHELIGHEITDILDEAQAAQAAQAAQPVVIDLVEVRQELAGPDA